MLSCLVATTISLSENVASLNWGFPYSLLAIAAFTIHSHFPFHHFVPYPSPVIIDTLRDKQSS